MNTLLKDIQSCIRNLGKELGFTVGAVMVLALGTGANIAIFSVVHSVLLTPLSYPSSDNILAIEESNPTRGLEHLRVSFSDFKDWERQSSSLSRMASYKATSSDLTGIEESRRIQIIQASSQLFYTLHSSASIGRTFTEDDDKSGVSNVAVLSNTLWREVFHSDSNITGHPVVLDDKSYTIIGVMPPAFQFPPDRKDVGIWIPLVSEPSNNSRSSHQMQVVARLRPGATVEQAQHEMELIALRLQSQYPESNKGVTTRVMSLKAQLVRDVQPALLMLMAAVGLMMLISCANVANLLLVKSSRRQREIAIRTALGGSRARILRLLLTESILLALFSCGVGLGLAVLGLRSIILFEPGKIPRLHQSHIDWVVMGFAIAASLISTVVFGLVPAVVTSKRNLTEVINEGGGKGSAGRNQQRASRIFVVLETALSSVLLVEAGLLVQSLVHLQNVDPGFETSNRYTMKLSFPHAGSDDSTPWVRVSRDLPANLAALPNVAHVGIVSTLPLSGDNILFDVSTRNGTKQDRDQPVAANFDVITPEYFQAMGIPLIKGRTFTEADGGASAEVAIINEDLAKKLWGAEDALHKELTVGFGAPIPRQVVGVVGNVKRALSEDKNQPEIYLPYQQIPLPFGSVVIRTSIPKANIFNLARLKIGQLSKDIVVYRSMTAEQFVADSLGESKFRVTLLGIFAGLSVVLAMIGIYGVMAFHISDRYREIGIRMALGADRRNIFAMIVGRGMLLTLIGEFLGLALSFAVTPMIGSFLYGVRAIDATTLLIVFLALAGAALLACIVPAMRAANLEPVQVLRRP